MAKAKTRREQLESLVRKIADIADACEYDVAKANAERDAAIIESKSRAITSDESDDPITSEGLSQFLDYNSAAEEWQASIGRLRFWCRVNGEWGLRFSATFGGSIGSYRKLKTLAEVKLLVELLGVMTYEKLRAKQGY